MSLLVFSQQQEARADIEDFDGDTFGDLVLFDPSSATFKVRFSSFNQRPGGNSVGNVGDVPAAGDFNGDGVADQAVFNRSTGEWNVLLSGGQSVRVLFGAAGQIPVPARYSGFDCTDLATYDPQRGIWTIANCKVFGPPRFVHFGGRAGDIPVVADYDRDNLADLALINPQDMIWRVKRSSRGYIEWPFGLPGDIPLPGDYDGNRAAQPAVYRPSTNQVFVRGDRAEVFAFPAPSGAPGDRLVVTDVENDGADDFASFHPTLQTFDVATSQLLLFNNLVVPGVATLANSSSGFPSLSLPSKSSQFAKGAVPGDFDRSLRSDFPFTRASGASKQWVVENADGAVFSTFFGFSNDAALYGDTDGDLRMEPIVVRLRADGFLDWFLRTTSGSAYRVVLGANGDKPLVGDFDCDGKDDITVVRTDPNSGGLTWYSIMSGSRVAPQGTLVSTQFGLAGDALYAADIDGDRCDDLVVAQKVAGGHTWFSYSLHDDRVDGVAWGIAGIDTPIDPIDFDGNGTDDPIVVRQENGFNTAYVLLQHGKFAVVPLGTADGIPFTGHFRGFTTADIGVYRRASAGQSARVTIYGIDGTVSEVSLVAIASGDTLITPGSSSEVTQTPSAPVPAPTPTNPGCNIVGDFVDGGGGKLWKPESDNTHNPVILMPRSYWTRVTGIDVLNRDGVKILEGRNRVCCPNGNRAHYDIPERAHVLDAQAPITIKFLFNDGSNECLSVPVPSRRYD
jgi:hypothetical protein